MKIGILGGGQLSRMLALAGIPLGLEFTFYFPQQPHALAQLGEVIHGDYTDHTKLKLFAKDVNVITYENENIPVDTINSLITQCRVFPDQNILQIAQHRLSEKRFFDELAIPTNQYLAINNQVDLYTAGETLGYPFILKTCTHGYDGKGQVKITNKAQIDVLPEQYHTNTIAEAFVAFDREVSIITARNHRGEHVFYDICENTHQNGILIKTENKITDPIAQLAQQYATQLINHINYVGVLAIEFFQVGDCLLANEIAPRVHNSGHWTIEASVTSQFTNHLRGILDWPLGDPSSLTQATMYNLLGQLPDQKTMLKFAGLCWHDYQKAPVKNRKLGHITLLNSLEFKQISELESLLRD